MVVIYGPARRLLEKQGKLALRSLADTESELAAIGGKPNHKKCTLCGKLLTFPCIFWVSCDGDIWLHSDCVMSWAVALLRDVDEIKHTTGKRPNFSKKRAS